MAPKGKRTKITGGIKYDPLIDTAWSKNMPLRLFDTKEQVTSKAIESSSMAQDIAPKKFIIGEFGSNTWLPKNINPKKKHFIDFFSQEGLDFTAPQNYAKERVEAHKIDPNEGWAASKDPKKGQYWQNAMSQMGKIALEFPDHPASINYNKLSKKAIIESGKESSMKLTTEHRQAGQKKSAETQRLKRVDEYLDLYDYTVKNNLTLDQAVTNLYKAKHGKDIPKATKHDQIIGAFYRIENELKSKDPNLHQFFENEIKAYQIGEATNKQLKYGTPEYEAARIELAKELGIDVRNIDRAHALMKPRLAKLYNLLQEGLITRKDYERLQRPSFYLLKKQNLEHVRLENTLDKFLERKKFFTDKKDNVNVAQAQKAIDGIIKEMDTIGVKSEMWDPVNKLIAVFGREPTKAEFKKLIKEQELTYKNKGGYIQSSLASVDEVLNGI